MAGPFLPLSKSPLDFGIHAAKHRSVTKTCTVAPLATRCRSAPPLPRPVLFQPPSTPLPVGALLHHSTTTSTAYIRSLRATHYSKGRTHPSPCWPPPSAPPALRGLARRGGSCGAPPSPAAASFLPALIKHQTTTLSRSPPKSLWPLSPSPGPPPLALLFNKSWHTRNPTPAANTIILRPPLLLSPGRLEPLLPCPALPLLSPRRLSPLLPDALFSTVFQTKPPLLACFSNTVVFLSSALSPTTTATNTQQHTQQHTTNTLLHITPAQTLPDCLPTLPSQVPRPPCSSCHNHHRNHHRRAMLNTWGVSIKETALRRQAGGAGGGTQGGPLPPSHTKGGKAEAGWAWWGEEARTQLRRRAGRAQPQQCLRECVVVFVVVGLLFFPPLLGPMLFFLQVAGDAVWWKQEELGEEERRAGVLIERGCAGGER